MAKHRSSMEQASPLAPQLTTNKETADPSYRAAGHKKRKAAAAAAVADQPGSGNKRQQQQQASAAAVVSQPDNQPRPAAAAAAAPTADAQDDDDAVRRLFRSWAWKREHRPDKDRFHRPYVHAMCIPGGSSSSRSSSSSSDSSSGAGSAQQQTVTLTIKQQKFSSEGFASTVWDSSIVVAKYLEKLGAAVLKGKRCLDLSAGCGLVGLVMAKLGAAVTVTDLAGNLPLLQHNCTANGVVDVAVLEHRWGEDVSALQPPFDYIVACDVMYVHELVQPLLQSLLALSSSSTVLIAHGRNRPAEADFRAAAAAHFSIELLPGSELDQVYQCSDVDVLRLGRL